MRVKKNLSRRNVIKLGIAGTVTSLFGVTESWGEKAAMPTPKEVEGPFYPVADQNDKDADLTLIAGEKKLAQGQPIIIYGSIKDTSGQAIENATIDIWQANAVGRYNHPRETNPAPRDPYFQGWAVLHSDKHGNYRIKTIKPGAYPATRTWTRPPHIHFKIAKPGFPTLITQMYFPGEPLNKSDLLFNGKNKSEQSAMIARETQAQDGLTAYLHNIVLSAH